MKSIILFLILILPNVYLSAQNYNINFETGSNFETALNKARENGKFLFVDCYTSWCGPCKMMAKTVFTIDSVANFFNSHFVNLKVDMEKGEGLQLKEKYHIEAYPTLLLIKEGMNPERSIVALKQKFAAGCRQPEFIQKYCEILYRGYQKEQLQRVLQDYFQKMDVKDICKDINWNIYNTYVQDIKDPLYHRMIENISEFKAICGDSIMEQKLGDAYTWYIFNSISNTSLTEEEYQQFSKDIEKIAIHDSVNLFYLKSYLELAHLKMLKQYDKILDIFETGPIGYNLNRRMTLTMSLSFLADGTKKQRIRGLKLMHTVIKDWQKREGEVLAPNISNVLGQVQQALMGKDISFQSSM